MIEEEDSNATFLLIEEVAADRFSGLISVAAIIITVILIWIFILSPILDKIRRRKKGDKKIP